MTDEATRAHPTWPAKPGVEIGCDDIDCGECYEQWYDAPLRDGEYDVAVMFRVTGSSPQDARSTVQRIVMKDQFERTIVPMFVPHTDVILPVTRADLNEITSWVERGIDDFEYLAGQDAGDYTPGDVADTRRRIEHVRAILAEASHRG